MFRNSSLSNVGFKFPICQDSTVATLPHPLPEFLAAGEVVELAYMDDICGNLTAEVDELVANGRAADSLLAHLETIEVSVGTLETGITELN